MKKQLLKPLRYLCMVSMMVLLLVGCGDQAAEKIYKDENGVIVKDEDVTLDVVSLHKYNKTFDELNSHKKRQKVIVDYLDYHLPDSDVKDAMIKQLSDLDVSHAEIPSQFESGLGLADSLLSQVATSYFWADCYSKISDNQDFLKFVETLGGTLEVTDIMMQFSKACFLISDLSNNDISNKEEYCNDVIDSLSLITSHVPVLDDYFTESLSVVKEGIQLLIKGHSIYNTRHEAYKGELEGSTIFSTITAKANFEFILTPQNWDASKAPTLVDVLKRMDEEDIYKLTTTQKDDPYAYLRKYIIYRFYYELQNSHADGHEHNLYRTGRYIKTPTCIDKGTEIIGCQNKLSNNKQCTYEILASGEDYGEHCYETVRKDSTCTKKGSFTSTCSVCDYTNTHELDLAPHKYKETVVAPTYDAQGYTLHECQKCDHSYKDNFVDTLPVAPPNISQPTTWYGKGIMHYTHDRYFELRVDTVSKDYISGYLEVYRLDSGKFELNPKSGERVATHQTTFHGEGKANAEGYEYLLKFDIPKTFGTVITETCSEMTLYYISEKDIFKFNYMYQVVMSRLQASDANSQ